MNILRRTGLILVAGASVTLVASPAAANSGDDPGTEVGKWMAVDESYWAPVQFQACGSVITMVGGDVREVEQRETTFADGSVRIDFRGGATVDLLRESDGAMIDELDISGATYERHSPDGSTIKDVLSGPSILFKAGVPANPADVAAFDEAGLPSLGYFTEGEVTIRIVIDVETGEPTSVDFTDVDAHIINLCSWFERHDDKQGHHDGEHGNRNDEQGHDDHGE
jgi:hypothetical protein